LVNTIKHYRTPSSTHPTLSNCERSIKLKRITKIDQWNILCRWALCRSPSDVLIPTDSNVEMSWHTFGGDIADILLIALTQWCLEQNLPTDKETLANQLRLHLHRGIGYIAGDPNLKTIETLIH
jgi:DNA sulfur modification protein DndE